MRGFEVEDPILSGPYGESARHWWLERGKPADKRPGRRPAMYWYKPPDSESPGVIEGLPR